MVGIGNLIIIFKTIFNAFRVTNVQEEAFVKGQTFSYEDYLIYNTDEVKYLYFDVSAFKSSNLNNLVVLPPAFSANAGPVTIEFYANPTVTALGTLLGVSNRRGTSDNVNKAKLYQQVIGNITDIGTRFSGRLVPSSGINPNQGSGSAGSSGLPFELDTSVNYLLKITNTDGAGVYVQTDFTWIEQ